MKNLSKLFLAVAFMTGTLAVAETGNKNKKVILDCENPAYHIPFETEPEKVKLDVSELLKMKPEIAEEKAEGVS